MHEVTTLAGEYVAWFTIVFIVMYALLYAIHPEALRVRGSHRMLPWSVFITATLLTLVILFVAWLASLAS